MSVVDKVIAAVTPPESEDARARATQKARDAAESGDFLSLVLDHHDQIREAFEEAALAAPDERVAAMKALALILNGHSLAEEIVLYPAMAKLHQKASAGMAYTEQTAVKMQMAELERLSVDSQEWLDKLEHIRGAVLHHMYEEEGDWLLELKQSAREQTRLAARFQEEFNRYTGRIPG